MQSQCFVELSSFNDLARFVCAFRDYPLRVYSHELNENRVLSSSLTLANTMLVFYTPMTKFGRYISYSSTGGKEYCDIVDSTKNISTYAPIIHLESEISSLPTETEKISDRIAYVLPNYYGWGMRRPDDKIWGIWHPDEKSPIIWKNLIELEKKYGIKLDIIYDDPQYDIKGKYNQTFAWNFSIN